MVATDLSLSDEARKHIVTALYRAFLQREPDAEGLRAYLDALQDGLTLQALVSAFLRSPEFHVKLPHLMSLYPLDSAPSIAVEVDPSPAERRTLWNKVAAAWSKLGEQDPYWSVLTHDQYRMNEAEAIDAFYDTGRSEVTRIRAWLERNGYSIPRNGTCVDYGCGVGRVTLWLARTFKKVIAVDISESHISAAREYLASKNIDNVEFHVLRGEQDLQVTRDADFFFSMIVLQHNPPPIMKSVLTTLLGSMRTNGFAFFQVPTYMSGYEFNISRYLKSETSGRGMEMHLLPQSEIFRIAKVTNCLPLEVQPDWLTGMWGAWISNTFLLRKISTDSKTETSWWGQLRSARQQIFAKKLRHLGRHKDDTEVIDAAYRGVLGRHADPEGMQHYTRMLKKNNYDLAPMLHDLLSSKEFGEHLSAKSAETDGVHREEWIYTGYRALLGREPDPGGLRHYCSMLAEGSLTLADLLKDIIASAEFREKSSTLSIPSTANRHGEPLGILRSEAEAIFESFSRFDGTGRPGYVTNFLGCLTDVTFVAQLDQLSGTVEGHPIPGNFHGDVLEWVGTLRSVLEAEDTFSMLELGAGWGPWCAIAHAAARQLAIPVIKTTGVEGDAGHVAHMRENFALNGLTAEEGRVIFGVVGANDGEAFFPKAIDASRVYGGAAAYENHTGGRQFFDLFVRGHGTEVEDVERVPCFSLKTLMSEAHYVDLIHCDIQGEEARLLTSAIAEVSDKVGRIVVGTHSFEIDRQLLMLLSTNGWELEGIDVCEMREDGQLPVTLRDGTQVWRNRRFDSGRELRHTGEGS